MTGEEKDDLNPRNRGLGRGLDAIFGEDDQLNVSRETDDFSESEDEDLSANEIVGDDLRRRTLPVEWLRPCAFQPRQNFDQSALEDLAKSIGMHGVLQPLLVRPIEDEDNQYEIIAGERRWRAAQIIQLHEVPVIVQYLDDEAVLEIALIENLQREDLNPIEEALAMQRLMDEFGHTQEKLSVSIGKSRSAIANRLRLLQLPESVQQMVRAGDLSEGHARSLIGQDNPDELAKQIISDNLSVRAVENLTKSKKQKKTKPKADKGVNTIALEEEMERLLGMRVTISASAQKGQGSVKIDYKSLDQLDELLHRLSKH
jgi:ParB family chromosome partitioning protein